MRYSDNWSQYELVDCSCGERLERWGDIVLIRPDPQVIWKTPKTNPLWEEAHARYERSPSGGGRWIIYKNLPKRWNVSYRNLTFNVKAMGFKHTGVFPEQAVNWDMLTDRITSSDKECKVLNLFGYTGCATVACLKAGASVCHVDASKGMVQWAKENAESSGVIGKPVRWIVDDCIKFVQREIRREHFYDIIIMDPPSYGRGPNKEIWKLEDSLYDFVTLCSHIMYDDSSALFLNSYTSGLSSSVMEYILGTVIKAQFGGRVFSDEIGIPVSNTKMVLPCGATAVWSKK